MDENYILDSYLVESIFNDYQIKHIIIDAIPDKIMTKKEIEDSANSSLLKFENCDSTYSVTIRKVYKIINTEYIKFQVTDYTYGGKQSLYNYPIMIEDFLSYELDTPNQNDPLKYKLEKEIYQLIENGLIDINGTIKQSSISQAISYLKRLQIADSKHI